MEAFRFDYEIKSKSTVHDKIDRVVDAMFEFVVPLLFHLQSADVIKSHMPQRWKEKFPETLIILDGLPMSIADRGNYLEHQYTFSPYKNDTIGLVVVGVSPIGVFLIRSAIYGGSCSETNSAFAGANIAARAASLVDIPSETMRKINDHIEIAEAYKSLKLPELRKLANDLKIKKAEKNDIETALSESDKEVL